jgi:hypothetical protein
MSSVVCDRSEDINEEEDNINNPETLNISLKIS